MKNILFLLLAALSASAHAQVGFFSGNPGGEIKIGVAYVHDFPGLNGFGAHGEYSFPLNEWLQGEVGLKRIQTSGYPRTPTVAEYTKATTLDFNLLFVPFHSENVSLRIGAGYAFSFYDVRRAFPVFESGVNGSSIKEPIWVTENHNGSIGGISLIGEFEYYFSNPLSIGARVSLCKAYSHVLMGGPFVAFRL